MTTWTPNLDPQLPRYLAIAQAIAADLESGRLSPGDKLPTHRELAWQLGVTVGTVTRAYQEAERRGLVSGEVGRGGFLRDPLAGRRAAVTAGERGPLDLQGAVPPRVCNLADFDQALMRLMADPQRLDHLDYPPVAGLPEHRDMARSWLRRAGVDVATSQVALTAGAQHGLLAILGTVARAGETLLVEPLTYPTVQPIARQLGLRLEPLRADDEGILPDSLDHAVRNGPGRILYLVPTLHNPTSIVLSDARRRAIAAIAQAQNLTIVEDDIFRLLLSEGTADAAVAGAGAQLVHQQPVEDRGTRSADRLRRRPAETGREPAAHHVRNRRQGRRDHRPYRSRLDRDRCRPAHPRQHPRRARIAPRRRPSHPGGAQVQCTPGSPFAWVTLPDFWRPIEFVSAALAMGIKLSPGDAFAVDRSVPCNGMRLCFGGAPSLPLLVQACEQLARLAAEEPVAHYQAMA